MEVGLKANSLLRFPFSMVEKVKAIGIEAICIQSHETFGNSVQFCLEK